MSQPPNPDEVRAALDPVWFNTYWIKNALGLYEGVSKHADELNAHHGLFFGVVQKFSLDAAALDICKMFDTSNPQYKKDTIPELYSYLKTHLTDAYTSRLTIKTLVNLGVPELDAEKLFMGLRTAFDQNKCKFLLTIEKLIPDNKNNADLKQLFVYRNKILAHQQRLDQALKEQLRYLPSLHAMEQLNEWAINFCLLSINLLTPNISLISEGRSTRMAALNVVVKLLDKKFDAHSARQAFFARIE